MHSFDDIYNFYYKKAYLFAKSYTHNDLASEDIATDALIQLWKKLKEEKEELESIPSFLFTILKNKALDYLKHKEIKLNALDEMADWQVKELNIRISTLEACDPKEIFSQDVSRIIRDTLDSLPPLSQTIFRMSRYENKSNKEIADLTMISVKGVEYHITKALKALRNNLKDYLPAFLFLF